MIDTDDDPPAERPDWSCQACGACCATSADWPRFSLESEEEIARIPAAHVDDAAGRMRSVDDRCTALAGTVGTFTACTVYAVRPLVCRECQPGDPECLIARARWGLPTAVDSDGPIG